MQRGARRSRRGFGASQEPEVSSSGVDFARAAGDQPRAELFRSVSTTVGRLAAENAVVSAGVVRGLHPNLAEMRIAAVALGVRMGDDDFDAGQQFPGFEQAQRMRTAAFHQRDPIVSQSSQIDVHARRFRAGRSLQTYRDVDATPETGGHGSRAESQSREQFRERRGQIHARPLFGNYNARSDARQIHSPLFQLTHGRG